MINSLAGGIIYSLNTVHVPIIGMGVKLFLKEIIRLKIFSSFVSSSNFYRDDKVRVTPLPTHPYQGRKRVETIYVLSRHRYERGLFS
jgi:hypothetical protein